MPMVFADRGLMKVAPHPAGGYKPMLPLNRDFKDCRGDNLTIFCFRAGKTVSFRYRCIAFVISINIVL